MRWHVIGRYEKRRRDFNMDAHTFDSARDTALSLVSYYAEYGGELTRRVWSNGIITIEAIDYPKTIIVNPSDPTTVVTSAHHDDSHLAEVISIRRTSTRR